MRRFRPTYNGGPVDKIKAKRAKRGLKKQEQLKHGPVLTVVQDGQVLLNKRFRRAMKTAGTQALSPQPSVSASAKSRKLPGRRGVSAITEPPPRENRLSEGASPQYWDTTPLQFTEERTPGRDRGSH